MLVLVVVIIMEHGMGNAKCAQQVHEPVDVILSETIQNVSSLRKRQFFVVK